MSAVEDVVTEAPAVEAVPKRAMTLGLGTSLVVLAALIIAPMFVKNFIIFQMTMLLIYALAVLALNILTGGSGQFSLGQSASAMVQAEFQALGTNVVVVFPGSEQQGGVRRGMGTVQSLTNDDSDALVRDCPSVLAASPIAAGG